MGQMTCPALLAFVGLHVALVLCAVALSTNVWMEGNLPDNKNISSNATHADYTVGLWEFCFNETCTETTHGQQESWYKNTRILETVTLAAIVVGLVLLYGFLLCKSCEDSSGILGAIVLCNLCAVGTSISAVALFGKHTSSGIYLIPTAYATELGWSFYVASVSAGVLVISCLCTIRMMCLARSRSLPYENI